jgi:hypothetical protein
MLWHSFHSAPLAGVTVLVCLATIFWCFWSLRRSIYDTLDRYLLGFIGLLAIYQGLRLLREIGLVTLFSNRALNTGVELTVAILYLLSAFIMRLSSDKRQYADFEVRSARAEPRLPLPASINASTSAAERQLLHIAALVPVLTDPAFKLYLYLCTRIDVTAGPTPVDDEALVALGKNRDEISILLAELEQRGICRLENDRTAGPITAEVDSPWQGADRWHRIAALNHL